MHQGRVTIIVIYIIITDSTVFLHYLNVNFHLLTTAHNNGTFIGRVILYLTNDRLT